MLNIEEIKAREQMDEAEPWENRSDIVFAAHARTDIPALIAEVEHCNEQHQCDVHNLLAMQTTIDQQAKNCEQLLSDDKQKIATLKKAYELMATYLVHFGRLDEMLCDDIPQPLHLKYQSKNDGNYANEPCIQCVKEYFLQQGQEQEKNQ